MSARLLVFAAVFAPSVALSLVAACGTTTTVSGPATSDADAACADPHVVQDGGGPVEAPEAGAPQCPSGVCNYQAQTGCAAGEACRPQFSATSPDVNPGCEAAGAGKSGATCAAGSDCAVGYFCAADKLCHKECCGSDWSACDPGESCIRQLQVKAGGVVKDSGMDLCFPVGNCDPLDSASCGTGQSCSIVDPTGAVACVPAVSAQPGDDCAATRSCAAGALCVETSKLDNQWRCRALCDAKACGKVACAPGQGICTHKNQDPPGVGECTPE